MPDVLPRREIRQQIPANFIHRFESTLTMNDHLNASRPVSPLKPWMASAMVAVCFAMPAIGQAGDTTPAAQLQRWTQEAGQSGNPTRGQSFFTSRQGGEWSCSSCHNASPTTEGKHANTGKTIAPLAPAFNAKAFTDTAKTDKWFRRNCKDVLSRECTAIEKADVLAFLIGLKP